MASDIKPVGLEDKEAVRVQLEDWLTDYLDEATSVKVSELVIPEEGGMSNVTILFDAEITSDSGTEKRKMVGRLAPPKDGKLVFPDYDLSFQYAIMEAIAAETDIPVPPLLALDETGNILGEPFYIMVSVDGIVPPDMPPYHMDGWLKESTPEVQAQIWWHGVEAMAKFHQVDPGKGKFAELLEKYKFPRSLNEQLAYWENYYEWALEGERNAKCELALQYLKENKPEDKTQDLCWGDSRMANVMFKPDKSGVAALIDWEMLTLGNPLQDLAWWIYMDELFSTGIGMPRLEGIPERGETAKRWAQLTGRSIDDLHYYLVFAGFRFALLLARISIGRGDREYVKESFASDYMATLLPS
jgi:aminoglycoside phosphotransferase (APT) family kinase protein